MNEGVFVAIIAGLAMLLGDIVAVSHQATSSASWLAFAAAQRPKNASYAVSAALFYMLAGAMTNLGAFAVERDDGTGWTSMILPGWTRPTSKRR